MVSDFFFLCQDILLLFDVADSCLLFIQGINPKRFLDSTLECCGYFRKM